MKRKRGRPALGAVKKPVKETITRQGRKDLKTLADDFGLLYMEEVQEIIAGCDSYSEGQQGIMRVYESVYLR